MQKKKTPQSIVTLLEGTRLKLVTLAVVKKHQFLVEPDARFSGTVRRKLVACEQNITPIIVSDILVSDFRNTPATKQNTHPVLAHEFFDIGRLHNAVDDLRQ
jgi:hypothetical protein